MATAGGPALQAGGTALPVWWVVSIDQWCGRCCRFLLDIGNWVSYTEAIAFWRAGARVTQHPSFARAVGMDIVGRLAGSPLAALVRSLSSPEEVYRQEATIASRYSTVTALDVLVARPGFAEIDARALDTFPRDPDQCAWTAGLLTSVPTLFGLAPAVVEHDRCQALGAPSCRYRIEWDTGQATADSVGPSEQADRLCEQVRALRGQLEAAGERVRGMFATASDLITADEIGDVLVRITDRAAIEVRAPRYVLAVRTPPAGELHCHSKGLRNEEATAIAERILHHAPDELPHSWLMVPVRSEGCDYGRLVAMHDSGRFLPQEQELLEVYARLAASALDKATALAQFRTLVDNLSCAVYRRGTGDGWPMQFISDPIEQISGHPASAFTSGRRGYADLIAPDVRWLIEEAMGRAEHAGTFTVDYQITRADGAERWVRDVGQLIGDGGGASYVDGTITDITELKQLEQERRSIEAELRLTHRLEAVGQLAAGIAHEINTPIGPTERAFVGHPCHGRGRVSGLRPGIP